MCKSNQDDPKSEKNRYVQSRNTFRSQHFLSIKGAESMLVSTFLMALKSFRQIQWTNHSLWVKKLNFGNLRSIFMPLTP